MGVSWSEADAALEAVRGMVGKMGQQIPLILSMEGALRDESTLSPCPEHAVEIAKRTIAYKKQWKCDIHALGFSCSEPETILKCLQTIQESPDTSKDLMDNGIDLS